MKASAVPPFLAGLLISAVALTARADEPADAPGKWESRTVITSTTGLFGYRPAKILEQDSAKFIAKEQQTANTMLAANLFLDTTWFEAWSSAYTVIPNERTRVNLAGLEIAIAVKLTDRILFGLYHHSAHNFPDPHFDGGYGQNLNGVTLDLRLLDATGRLFERTGWYRWSVGGRRYLGGDLGNAGAFVITEDTRIPRRDLGTTSWRWSTRLEGVHPFGRAACEGEMLEQFDSPSSVSLTCNAGGRMAIPVLGEFGKHLFVGPTVTYGRNLERVNIFGTEQWWGGLRVDLFFDRDVP